MRTVIQRAGHAKIKTESQHEECIGVGLVILLGIEEKDTTEDIEWLVKKIINLRIFPDESGRMNLSAMDIGGEFLVVSQFTLHASTKKGNRPSYIRAAGPDKAIPLYEKFVEKLEKESGRKCATGVFGDYMEIELRNDGPVTIIIDTKNRE